MYVYVTMHTYNIFNNLLMPSINYQRIEYTQLRINLIIFEYITKSYKMIN